MKGEDVKVNAGVARGFGQANGARPTRTYTESAHDVTRGEAAKLGTEKLKARTSTHIARTLELAGRTNREIGKIIAAEEGHPDEPFAPHTVSGWRTKGSRT